MRPASREVAVFDLDGTITDCDTYVEFLKLCLIRQPSRLVRSVHLPGALLLHKAGYYDNAWLKETFLTAIAGGYAEGRIAELAHSLVSGLLEKHVRSGARDAIRRHRDAGHRLLLATASFDFYVASLAEELGFDEVVCTTAARDAGNRILGKIDGKNCYGAAKVEAVLEAIPDRESCRLTAYTDHHSDWALLQESDLPVAVHPTGALRRLALANEVDVQMW
jgi:HAD superfamily hydrolase (TIGR01490 family)